MTKHKLGLGQCTSFYSLQSIIQRSQGRHSREEPGSKNRNKSHGGSHLAGLYPMAFSGVSWITSRGDTAPSELGPFPSISSQENTPQLAHRPIRWGHFLIYGSLFPKDSSLCQVDSKLTGTSLLTLKLKHCHLMISMPLISSMLDLGIG